MENETELGKKQRLHAKPQRLSGINERSVVSISPYTIWKVQFV